MTPSKTKQSDKGAPLDPYFWHYALVNLFLFSVGSSCKNQRGLLKSISNRYASLLCPSCQWQSTYAFVGIMDKKKDKRNC